jgi:hypothetical protein
MAPSMLEPGDLLDLKLLPAWVKEPGGSSSYADYEGEEPSERGLSRERRPGKGKGRAEGRGSDRAGKHRDRRRPPAERGRRPEKFRSRDGRPSPPPPPLDVAVRFVPKAAVLQNVVSQVQADALAYSLFFLARLFLDKPHGYEVQLTGKGQSQLYQLGETGPVSLDRSSLEANAFRFAAKDFYRIESTQSEPVKGNFTTVARCRLTGTVFGPTNHHDYQRRLRNLYEQRFSRRMSFAEYQRQVEIVTDPAAVEKWKEDARTITSFITLKEESPLTFVSGAEAERHFRQKYLPGLVRMVEEVTIDGAISRQLSDQRLRRHIEQAWVAENRSPSNMMQELAKNFREAGLHVFRHRRGMLFISPIRVRPFVHDGEGVSPHVKAIIDAVSASPRIRRKDLAETVLTGATDDVEQRKLALASDLRWLISEGYLIEFNDGSLDLPRVKMKQPEKKEPETAEIAGSDDKSPVDSNTAAEEQGTAVSTPPATANGDPEAAAPITEQTSDAPVPSPQSSPEGEAA